MCYGQDTSDLFKHKRDILDDFYFALSNIYCLLMLATMYQVCWKFICYIFKKSNENEDLKWV